MKSLPSDVTAYKRTAIFTEISIPKGLLGKHRTKEGTWGKIVVHEGRLIYRILEPGVEEVQLSPEVHGVVEPAVLHQVEPLGAVRFYVEFHR